MACIRLLTSSVVPRCEQHGHQLRFFLERTITLQHESLLAKLTHPPAYQTEYVAHRCGNEEHAFFVLSLPPAEQLLPSPMLVELCDPLAKGASRPSTLMSCCGVRIDLDGDVEAMHYEPLRTKSVHDNTTHRKKRGVDTAGLSTQDQHPNDRDEGAVSACSSQSSSSEHSQPGAPAPPAPVEIKEAVGSNLYKFDAKLGSGAGGTVWRSYHQTLQIPVAIKQLQPTLTFGEAQILARIRHPNVVEVKEAFTHGGLPYIVMEYLEGESLSKLLRTRAPFGISLGDVMYVATSLLRGVRAIHDMQFIHCDINPNNTQIAHNSLVCGSPKHRAIGASAMVKIINFGLAVPAHQLRRVTTTTPTYYSWEQQHGIPVTWQTDLFQVARVVEECLKHCADEAPPALHLVINKAKAGRFASATDMLGGLAALAIEPGRSELQNASLLRDVFQSFDLPVIFDRATKGGYKPEHILASWNEDLSIHVPPEHERAYRDEVVRVAGRSNVWDGKQLALKQAYPTRVVVRYKHQQQEEEEPALALKYSINGYFHAVAMKRIFTHALTEQESELMRVPLELSRFADPNYYTSCGVHIGIITTDSQLVYLRRSTHVNQSTQAFTCGAVEGMSDEDIDPVTGCPSPFLAAVRALKEEVHIALAESSNALSENNDQRDQANRIAASNVHLLGLICKPNELKWGFVGYIDLREPQIPPHCRYASTDIEHSLRLRAPRDTFEHDLVRCIPFNIDSVLRFLQENREHVVSSAVACSLFILFDEFDEHGVLLSALQQQ